MFPCTSGRRLWALSVSPSHFLCHRNSLTDFPSAASRWPSRLQRPSPLAGAGLTLSASLKQSAAALPKPSNDDDDDAAHLCAASLSDDGGPPRPDIYVHPLSKVEFPKVIDGEKQLLSVGTRLRRPYFWIEHIIYVFGTSTLLFFKQINN